MLKTFFYLITIALCAIGSNSYAHHGHDHVHIDDLTTYAMMALAVIAIVLATVVFPHLVNERIAEMQEGES